MSLCVIIESPDAHRCQTRISWSGDWSNISVLEVLDTGRIRSRRRRKEWMKEPGLEERVRRRYLWRRKQLGRGGGGTTSPQPGASA